MQFKKALFIYNPRAGKGLIKQHIADIILIARECGFALTVVPTTAKGDAIEILKSFDLKEYDRILCSGGDGTLCEVFNGIEVCNANKSIGYIPAGSTNDFAASLNIPKDMDKAAQLALKSEPRPYDVGMFNGEYFVYVAAFGMFTDVAYSTDQGLKNVLGHLAYVLKGATELSSIRSYKMKLEYDEGVVEGDFLLGLISSTTSIGGVLDLSALDVSLDDGYFEVVLIKAPDDENALANIREAIATGEDIIHRNLIKLKASHLHIYSYERAPWTLDGEYGGDPEEIEIKNLNKKMLICKS